MNYNDLYKKIIEGNFVNDIELKYLQQNFNQEEIASIILKDVNTILSIYDRVICPQIIQEFAEFNFKGYDDKMFQNILNNNIFLSDDAYKQELEQNNNKKELITNILYRIFCKHILEMNTDKNITIRQFHLLAVELMNSKNIDEFYKIIEEHKNTFK